MGHVVSPIGAAASEVAFYDWQGRSAKRNHSEIQAGPPVPRSVADVDEITLWLIENVCAEERSFDHVRDRTLKHCRSERIERGGLRSR
ncbi:hypothetical protein [Haloactinospora alba]|uniref:hypothetical protein n=1 Tax=Haloactinospora alba TaxID=405555 RepID=UPI00147686B4|nr:hypothetical protein [Haloactinospora alba]